MVLNECQDGIGYITATADSRYYFRAITPNGGVVGPLIRLNKGEDFQVNVINKLTDPTMRRSTSIVSDLDPS
jgi:FtsP/CotA-like multicopper oxidase with cupredoxin domain